MERSIHCKTVLRGVRSVPSKLKVVPCELLVHVTCDAIGKTLSVGSVADDLQFSIPLEELMPVLRKVVKYGK